MTLGLIQVDVKTSEPMPNADFINVNVDAVVNIKAGRDPGKIDLKSLLVGAFGAKVVDAAKRPSDGL